MQQTYGGVARAFSPLFFGWAFDSLGVSSPYFFASVFIFGTVFLSAGLDKYAKLERPPAPAAEPVVPNTVETPLTRSDYPATQTSSQPLSAGSDK
jgi:hypothetical protein